MDKPKNRIEKCFKDKGSMPPISFFKDETERDEMEAPEPEEVCVESMFIPPPLTEEERQAIYRTEDRLEINFIVEEIRFWCNRMDKYAFNPKMRASLLELVTMLMVHKKALVKEYHNKYGKPKVI